VRAYQGGHTARGAVSLERLAQDANGALLYTFTHPWSDGTTGIRLSPVELLEKLAAGEQPTLSGARGGQRAACLAASRALVRLGGGTRWCRVGDRVGARRRWKRPFDFPILSIHVHVHYHVVFLEGVSLG
jgi:hypothetical protein